MGPFIYRRILTALAWSSVSLHLATAQAASPSPLPPDHAEKMTRGLPIFQQHVRPLLLQHCVPCHGGERTRSEFDLTTREGLLRGGKSGPSVQAFDAAQSSLLKQVRHEVEPGMPDQKPKLPDSEIQFLATWIELGAPYDEPLVAAKRTSRDRSVVTESDREWWAFQPLKTVTPPHDAPHPIDAFLRHAARSKAPGLSFNPSADRERLLRRVSLDLTGLPPSPVDRSAFLADSTPEAWSRLVSRLLDSPAYGERWARHWLDVARFAESSGFEHDYDRPNAYHYRDYVIRALNSDQPFDQFVHWQIAGDEFAPDHPPALAATGFLGAGVFPTQITANEVERTRYDALDDMLATTGSAFLGLTLGCARCHDHKYDPIPTHDYYRLLSTFTTTVRSNVELDLDPEAAARARESFAAESRRLEAELSAFETKTLQPQFATWLRSPEAQIAPGKPATVLEVTRIQSSAGATFKRLPDGSWLAEGRNGDRDTYTLTGTAPAGRLTGIRLDALTDPSAPQRGPGRAGNGNFALSRIRVLAGPKGGGGDAGPRQELKLLATAATHQQNTSNLSLAGSLDDNPQSGWAVDGGGIGKDQAAVFAAAEPIEFPEGGGELTITLEFAVNTEHNLVRPRVSVFIDTPAALTNEVLPAALAALAPKVAAHQALTRDETKSLFDWWARRQPGWRERQTRLDEHSRKVPGTKTPVLVCGEGFTPLVMHSQGPPFLPVTHHLQRGDPNQKKTVAEPGFLQVLSRSTDGDRWRWNPPSGAKYSGRRRALAGWLTDPEHGAGGLLARVAVNRLWQHHFGRGIVSTPNDFGRTGTLPTHPELLDWLAGELIRNGWRLKPLHQLILTSAAYQQSVATDPTKLAADPENQLWLRRQPRRLEAEAIRDSALAVSGVLDRTLFGPGTLDERSRRRSIYFTIKRSRLVNSMVVFDAPEPLTSQGFRPVTTVAPQALLLLNSPQARDWADALARQIEPAHPAGTGQESTAVRDLYQRVLGRDPRPEEVDAGIDFLQQGTRSYRGISPSTANHLAWTDYCQTLLALNEFIYVE